jgi:hypothetical protein
MRPKLKISCYGAQHFLNWELRYFKKHFEVVQESGNDVVLLVFGPDILKRSSQIPALRRVAMLFPGWWCNPYHNEEYRRDILDTIDASYDLAFVNPGPLEEAYKMSKKVVTCSFTIDTALVRCKRLRRSIDSLLHISADSPQKDWKRSAEIMQLTNLAHEVFPPRGKPTPFSDRAKIRLDRYGYRLGFPTLFGVTPGGYVSHRKVLRKYQQYDGFVHVAAEFPHPEYLDGKYTAALLEAGATGAILFWHDTFGLGNDLETVFDLPLDPNEAAQEILQIRRSLDVEKHSRSTREEILDKFDPERSVEFRAKKIKELL